jgi:hypothetical protein
MKYLGVSLLMLLLALSVETSAQDNPLSRGGQRSGKVVEVVSGQGSCPDYKIGIITPPKNVDFKMRLLTPPKNLDPGIVFKPCELSSQLSLAPQLFIPNPGIQFLNGPNQQLRESLKGQLIISGKNK